MRGAGYIAIKNGKANITGRSGHYMKDSVFGAPGVWEKYDAAIRQTFGNFFKIIDHNMGGNTFIRPPAGS